MKKCIPRALSLLVSIGLLFGLASCNNNQLLDPKNPITITIWHYYNGSQLVGFDNMVTQFNQTVGKEQGIQVESFSQGGVNDLARLVLNVAEGSAGDGRMPDIFNAYPDTAYELKEMGVTADLRPYLSDEEIAEYVDSFWDEGRLPPDDVLTIFPMAKSTELIQIDHAAWQQFLQDSGAAGLSDRNFDTWEGILEAAQQYYDYTDSLTPDVQGDGKALFGIDSAANFLYVVMRQQGVTLLGYEDGRAFLNLADEQALGRAFDLYYGSVVRGWFGHVGRYRSDDVKTGEILGFIGSSTGSMYFPDVITYPDGTQQKAEMAAYPMPTFADGTRVAIQQGAGMVVAKSEEAREYASVTFLKWLTEQEQNLQFAVDSAYLPVKKDALFGEQMRGVLQEMYDSGDTGMYNTALVLDTVLGQLQTHELYFTEPFAGLFEVRLVLESIEEYSNLARERVLEAVAGGEPYEAAVEAVVGDEAFHDWLTYVDEQTREYFQ